MFGKDVESWISGNNVPGITLGIVSNVDDPEELNRIKVKVPAFGKSYESCWASVVTSNAGQDAGFSFLPSVGDEVLVVFKGGDLNYPYILGSVWSKDKKPPKVSQDAKDNMLVIKSRKGHTITVDDEKNTIILQLSSGHHLSLKENTVCLSDKDGNNALQIDASIGEVTLMAASKLVLSAPSIEIKASQSLGVSSTKMNVNSAILDMQASASQSLKTNGILTISGSLVKIN
ncbi:MAG: hypothetical protein EHM14_01390 [Methanothrix sp.]|nr:MAG: hypothetical protein EHM14_01390 [Methanothrix sp.]